MPLYRWDVLGVQFVLNWKEMRRDVFAILLMAIDGHTVADAVLEADNLIEALDQGKLGAEEPI